MSASGPGMHADALNRILRRHRFATAQDLTFALGVSTLLVLAMAQLFAPFTS